MVGFFFDSSLCLVQAIYNLQDMSSFACGMASNGRSATYVSLSMRMKHCKPWSK